MEKNKTQPSSECDFDTNVYDPTHSCNKFLLRQEYKERETTQATMTVYIQP